MEDASEEHYYLYTEQWIQGKITASERRVLISQWVGQAWEDLCHLHKDTIVRSLRKCGISLPNIEGVSTYKAPDLGQFISFDPKDPDEIIVQIVWWQNQITPIVMMLKRCS